MILVPILLNLGGDRVLHEEIQLIKAAGADVIQLDEPWMALLVDADARAMFSSPVKTDADLAYELQLAVDMMNKTLEGIEGIVRSLPAPLPVPMAHHRLSNRVEDKLYHD